MMYAVVCIKTHGHVNKVKNVFLVEGLETQAALLAYGSKNLFQNVLKWIQHDIKNMAYLVEFAAQETCVF